MRKILIQSTITALTVAVISTIAVPYFSNGMAPNFKFTALVFIATLATLCGYEWIFRDRVNGNS